MNAARYHDVVVEHYRHYVPLLSSPRVGWDAVRHKLGGPKTRYGAILAAIERFHAAGHPALDVGVGTGLPLLLYARVFPAITWHGVDAPCVTFDHPDLAPFRPRIRACDLEKDPLPFADGTFGSAIFSEVAEHLPPPAFTHALEQMHRVLAPGGVVIATSPNLVSLMNRLIVLAGRSPFHLPIRDPNYYDGFPHIHLYSTRDVCALGRRLGFEVAAVWHLTYFSYALIGQRRLRNAVIRAYLLAERALATLCPSLRDGWLVVLRKRAC